MGQVQVTPRNESSTKGSCKIGQVQGAHEKWVEYNGSIQDRTSTRGFCNMGQAHGAPVKWVQQKRLLKNGSSTRAPTK